MAVKAEPRSGPRCHRSRWSLGRRYRLHYLLKTRSACGNRSPTAPSASLRWLTGYSALIAEGKRIKSQLQDDIPF